MKVQSLALSLKERVRIAGLNATLARRSLDVWWVYVGPNNEPRHLATMKEYSHFFRADKQAHFFHGVVGLASLCDPTKRTITVRHIVHKAVAEGFKALKPLMAEVDAYDGDPRRTGILHIRNKLFAHRDVSTTYAEAFEEAGIRPMDLFDMSDEGFSIIARVADEVGAPPPVHDTIAPDHAEQLLLALRHAARVSSPMNFADSHDG